MNNLQRPLHFLLLLGLAAFGLSGCVTRTEVDYYTITLRDTTLRSDVRNAPGAGTDNGTVFPSSRVTTIHRETVSYDSTQERDYPAFLRYGGVEFAGLIDGAPGPGYGPGLFGVYSLLDSTFITENRTVLSATGEEKKHKIFKGHIFRVLPLEYRLRWFDDAPDWTIGLYAYESIAQNDDPDKTLRSNLANVYIRKRYWLRDKKPYLIASPYFGLSLLPSAYVNLGSELTLGSYGGFNIRGYLGVASGFNWKFGGSDKPSEHITTPYIGLGISALDFINKVGDLEREWKDYAHSAIEVSVIDLDLLYATAGYPNLFDTTVARLPLTGFNAQFATAHFPIHNLLDGKFWFGTSLFKLFALGYNQFTFSALPVRFGWRQYLIAEDLTLEPQLELNYYPSQYINLSTRLRLNTFRDATVGFVLGFAHGSTGAFLGKILYDAGFQKSTDLSSIYLGISVALKDRMHTPEKVREMERWEESR